MSSPLSPRLFELHLADGRVWHGVEFPSGHVAINHPDEHLSFTVALTLDGLLTDQPQEHPLHGARVRWPDDHVRPHRCPTTPESETP